MALTYKNTVGPVIAGLVLAATAVTGAMTLSGQNAELEQQRVEISDLRAEVAGAMADAALTEQAAAASALGADPHRVREDSKHIMALALDAFSWDSEAAYNDARAGVTRIYDIPEDSGFLTTFLPPAPETRDADGNRYSYIDAAGLNSSVGDVATRLLSVRGINYRYMTLVTVQSSSSDGMETAGNVATVFVTIDGDGAMSDVSGFAATERPRSSG